MGYLWDILYNFKKLPWPDPRPRRERRYGAALGRVIEPGEETGGLSVDVVDLTDLVGSRHSHPGGEVCMVMPVTPEAQFDGTSRGWCVFEPGSAHYPTVTNGEALILYMLPDGKIDYTDAK